jgi:MFS family permease
MKKLGKNYWLLWSGFTVSTLGTYLTLVIINLYIYQVTGSPFMVGLFLLFKLIPAFFMGNIAGVLADKYDRRFLIIIADITRAVLIFSVIFLKGNIYPLYFIIFGIAICDRLYSSCLGGSIPNIAEKENILSANSYLSAGRTIALVTGPMLGGVFASMNAYTVAFSIDASTYLLSALTVALITAKFQSVSQERRKLSMWSGLKESYGFIFARFGLMSVMLVRCLDAFGSSALNVGSPIFSGQLKQFTPSICYGLIYVAFGVGEMVGALYLAKRTFISEKPTEVIVGWSTLFMALFFGLAFSGTTIYHTMFFMFLSAIMEGVTTVNYSTYIQKSPDEIRGRIVGASETGVWTSMGIGMFISGLIAEKINIVYVVQAFASLIVIGCTVHLIYWWRKLAFKYNIAA